MIDERHERYERAVRETVIPWNIEVIIIDEDCDNFGKTAVTADSYRHESGCVCVMLKDSPEDGASFYPLENLKIV